jgi:hypothetical protein
MEEKDLIVEETTNNDEVIEEIQNTFNEDGLEILVEDGEIENEYKN